MKNTRILYIAIPILCIVTVFYFYMKQANSQSVSSDAILTNSQTNTPHEKMIIAFGDSLTAGHGLPEGESYPRQLENKLRADGYSVRVINSGVSGETTAGNKARASFIASQNADIVLLGIGGNDALRYLPIEETKKNIEETIDILKANSKTQVILLGMRAPMNTGIAYKRQFDGMYQTIANTNNIPLIPFVTDEIFLNKNFKLEDGIHLNKEGYKKIVDEYIYPVIKTKL